MDLPSGDQVGAEAPSGRSVKGSGLAAVERQEVDLRRPGLAVRPPGRRRNSSREPSGDQRGQASRGPLVSRRGSPPEVGTAQIEVS